MRSRLFSHTAPFLFALATWSGAASAQVPTWQSRDGSETSEVARASTDRGAADAKNTKKDWLLSVEAVTHAPVDMGVQLGFETPQRLRLFGSYGWVPEPYMGLLTGVAAGASNNSYAKTLLDDADYTGRSWRIQVGFRPFKSLGLYADVGYANLKAKGALDLASSSVPALARLGGGYRATTTLDMWLFELGYQGQVADRLVLGMALGAMGTFESMTNITSVDGAPGAGILRDVEAQADGALESYGIVPTLTLRAGFDLI
jgi:hypothetical protein